MSLLTRLYVLVVLAVAPAMAILAWSTFSMAQQREADAEREASRAASAISDELGSILGGIRALLVAGAQAPVLREGAQPRCERFIEGVAPHFAELASIALYDMRGKPLCGSRPLSLPPDFVEVAAGSSGLVQGPWLAGGPGGMLPFALGVRTLAGEPAGLIVAALDLGWLRARLASRPLPPGSSLSLLDRRGTILVRLPDPGQEGRPAPAPWASLAMAEGSGHARSDEVSASDGVARVVAYESRGNGREGMVVAVGLSRAWALADLEQSLRTGLPLLVLAAVLAMAAAALGGRYFVLRPIEALLAAASQWRAGNLDARTGYRERHSELGRLAALFDSMAERIAERERQAARAMEALQESEQRFRQYADTSPDVLWIVDARSGDAEFVGPAFETIWQRRREEIMQSPALWLETVEAADRAHASAVMRQARAGEIGDGEYRIRRADGEQRWIRETAFPIRDAQGHIVRIAGVARDITPRKRAEEERQAARERIELVLKELNHRIKNNLQIVTSLLHLQASQQQSEEVRGQLAEAGRRVAIIAEVHASLYRDDSLDRLALGPYLRDLCGRLSRSLLADGGARLDLQLDTDGQTIDMDRAVPLGLMLNELMAASARSVSAAGADAVVRVRLEPRTVDTWQLAVCGEGGSSAGGAESRLGVLLIQGFVRQLGGRMSEEGRCVRVDFPV
ncbi:histidine kinase dimerization/phosphoacceptor domain -containing protein [Geminicoccaceae bacterium 1502E]|nr:histidine kinase dimerization/phosphoacceptor domain -containing protein [Geminicoccaceae bacterium 1502E]